METETILVIDATTGESVERALTAEEIESRQEIQAESEATLAAQDAKAVARESALAKLADLGLTAEEIAAL